jgi:zinc protease
MTKTAAINRAVPPPAGTIEPAPFPAFVHRRLPMGISAYVAQMPGRPLLSLELLTPAGAQHDPPGGAGLATLTGGLLDEGAGGMNAIQVADRIEGLGGQLATGADWNVGYAGLLVLSQHAQAGLRLLGDVVAAPAFPQAEFERVRRLRLTELVRRRHQPSALADEHLAAAVYRGTVYANTVLGTAATVSALDREQIAGFYRERYLLPAATLIAVSDLDPEVLLAQAAQALAQAAGGAASAGSSGSAETAPGAGSAGIDVPDIRPAPLAGVQIYIVDRPGAAQTELRLGHAGVPRPHPDRSAIVFLNALLGGKFTSRINLNLREGHGYTYSASTRFASRLGPGPFEVSTAVGTEVAGAATREVLGELRRIQDEPVTHEEMEETRSYIIGVFPYTLQTVSDVGRRLADLAIFGLPDDHFERNLQIMAALTRADIQRAAQLYLDPDHIAVVAVGPADLLRPQFESMGQVHVRTVDDVGDAGDVGAVTAALR